MRMIHLSDISPEKFREISMVVTQAVGGMVADMVEQGICEDCACHLIAEVARELAKKLGEGAKNATAH